uniref:SFRICE_029757 n=1 Tax=Spodoptera frugiperda TaxID=7108 RepID=A0A2H1WI69_SPOFR
MLSAYARFIVRHSYLTLFTVAVISSILTVIPLVCHDVPSFSDPIVGFETRGTTLAHRFIAWENLIEETRPSRSLAVNPKEIEDQIRMNQTYYNRTRQDRPRSGRGRSKKKGRDKKKKVHHNNDTNFEKNWPLAEPNISSTHVHWGFGKNKTFEDDNAIFLKDHTRKQWVSIKEMQRKPDKPITHNYASGTCGPPISDYAHLVITNTDNTSLLTFENVGRMCRLQSMLVELGEAEYYKMCQRDLHSEDICCPVWSVPNYIALMSGKTSCENLSRDDVSSAVTLLKKCAGYFHNFSLMASCDLDRCKVPKYCSQYDAIYNMLFYLIDSQAFTPSDLSQSFVKNVMLFLPLASSSTVLPYYEILQSSNLSYETLVIPAMDFGLKNALFDLWTMKHSITTMAVTTLTTAVAFLASYVSYIPAINCFSVFAVMGAIGIGSLVVVFYYPGLQLPDLKQFQLFQTSHPFEQYDMVYSSKFLFERFGKDIGTGSKMPLRWIWGVKAIDNGNHMDPASKGHIEFDHSFSVSNPDSQKWLAEFCHRIKSQPFFQPTLGPLLPNCFIESFKMYMSRRCIDHIDKINRTPCCETSVFPYKKEVFEFCIIKAMESLYQTPRELFMPGVAGPKFLRNANPTVSAIVVEFESNVPYSMSYTEMDYFYSQVENWTQHELKSAPPEMQSGWFLSDLQFYDLQKTLASGTVIALILSATLGFIVLVPATLSLVISSCALVAMIFSATVTIAILVLNGWKLNVLESVAISTSAGLAVDFNLHYALSYANANGAKSARVKCALSSSSGPTAAAALTTGFAGIFLLRSNLLPYSQIGSFLALIMVVSWSYATFFLCSLLQLVGRNSVKESPTEERKSVSRVSSVCSGVPNLESHELEHLADSSRTNLTHSHSPSNASATTVVLHDDYDNSHNKIVKKSSDTSNNKFSEND